MQSVKCIFNFVYCVFLPYLDYLDQCVSITVEKCTKRTLSAISSYLLHTFSAVEQSAAQLR